MDTQRLVRFQNAFLRARRTLTAPVFGEGRLPRSTFTALFDIRRQGGARGVTVSALAARGGVSVSAVSQLLRSLEKKGLVERTLAKEDRRVVYVQLTGEGERMLDETAERLSRRLDELLGRLGSDDTEQLMRILARLDTILQEMRAEEKEVRKRGNDL